MPKLPASLLVPLYNLDGYRRYFTNAAFWEPFVRQVCQQHRLGIVGAPRVGLPGSFPTFIISDSWVVKFFGPLFDGIACFQAEQAAINILPTNDFPIPARLASGSLFPGSSLEHSWPYLIYEYVPAPSIGAVYDQISDGSRRSLARQLGTLLRRMHAIPLPSDSIFSPDWQSYKQRLTRLASDCLERHTAWGSLSAQMLNEIPSYLLPTTALLPPASSPSLIHADLTRDHLLGNLKGDEWHLQAIIDFGDAISGDLLYELVVLHLEIFNTDPRLLKEFLDTYQVSPFHQENFIHKVMTLSLLQPFDMFALVFERHPKLQSCTRLDELAYLLWDMQSE